MMTVALAQKLRLLLSAARGGACYDPPNAYCRSYVAPFSMTYTEAYRVYLNALRNNPRTPPPAFRAETVDDFHAWKAEMRAHDAARLELKLATPQEIQAENSAIQVRGGPWRIVEHARYP